MEQTIAKRRYLFAVKKFKMKTMIIFLVSVTTAVGIALLCILASVNSNTMLHQKINENMSTYLNAQVNAVEEFVRDSEQKLKLFSESDIVKQLIREDAAHMSANPGRQLPEFNDPSYNTTAFYTENYPGFPAAQQYTLNYYNDLDNWEGIYVGNLETRILTYSVPPVIGRVLRPDPAKVDELMNAMKADLNGVYNAGIIVSPGTGQLCLSMYCPVLEDGVMIGYVGAGVFHTDLEKLLKSLPLSGVTQSNFYMINTRTGITYTDTEASEGEQAAVIAQETTRPLLREVISRSATGERGQFEFKDQGRALVVNYEKIPGYDWALVITADKKEIYQASNKNLTIMIILGLITFALIITFVTLLTIRISRSLVQTVNELDKACSGDISSSVQITSRVAEIDQIGRSLSDLKQRLSGIITRTREMSNNLNTAGSDLAGSADQAFTTSSHITEAVAEVSRGAASQSESVQTAALCTDNMGNDIDDISANISALDEATGNMKANCDKVAVSLGEIVKQNITVSNAISEIGRTIDATNKSANDIAKFSEAINSIASQTNLLSLNASIEAARAGEAGKGFAVVADEIRQLADQSKNSADEIKSIIDKLIVDVEASVKTMDTLDKNFQKQGEQIISAQHDMEEMSGNMSIVAGNSESISGMVRNLENAKSSLVDIVGTLSAISEENAASTQETSTSMNELDSTFSVINESAGQLRQLASDLAETISYFK